MFYKYGGIMCKLFVFKNLVEKLFFCRFMVGLLICLFASSCSFAKKDVFYAIDKGDLGMFKAFLNKDNLDLFNKGAKFNSFAQNETFLNAACYKGDLDFVEAAVSYLYKNICRQHEDKDKKFKDEKLAVYINKAGVDDQTPLHCACHPAKDLSGRQSLEVVEYLVENGATHSVNMRNAAGRTPVDLAFECKNFEVIKHLVKNGAKVNVNYVKALMRGAGDAKEVSDSLNNILLVQRNFKNNYDYKCIVSKLDEESRAKSFENIKLVERLSLPKLSGARARSDSELNSPRGTGGAKAHNKNLKK